ncbi:MFS transporter [Ensifer adhaerens]|uniref:MFS transporter n=1 Tax=Ensifer adhaerens TaxID=106592 RepID=UPI0023A9F9AE|nr:MFS transporter [Ensifer adhaerens]WDZ75259.1 MFS transporter [Ensifer adhaerens]
MDVTSVKNLSTRKTAILAIIIVSYLMIVLDISIVITGLPKIRDELQFSDAGLSWVHSAYTLAFGGFLLLGARAGDILGRRRLFMAGLAIFTAASVVIGFAPSPAWMLGARAVQGFGSAILAPATLALIQTHFAEGPERTRAVAYYSSVAGIGASFGMVLGGLLAGWLSWRVGFFINLPIGIALMLAARRYVGETERRTGEFDLAGAVSSTLGMTALVYGIVRSAEEGAHDPLTLAALALGLLLLAVFVVNERRARQPIMPLRLFASRERVGAYLARVLFLAAMIGFFFFFTQYLQGVLDFDPLASGLAFIPATLVNFVAAISVPRLVPRFGNQRLLGFGLISALIGMLWISQISAETSFLLGMAPPLMLIGLGQGFTLSPLTVAGIAGVAPGDAGAAGGVVNVAHQLGNSLGLSVLVAVAARGADGLAGSALLAHRVDNVLIGCTILLAAALAVVALIVRPHTARRVERPATDRSLACQNCRSVSQDLAA